MIGYSGFMALPENSFILDYQKEIIVAMANARISPVVFLDKDHRFYISEKKHT